MPQNTPEKHVPQDSPETARTLYNKVLDDTGRAVLSGDFDLFRSYCALPFELETFSEKRILETENDMRAVFDALCIYNQKNGVTDLVMQCIEASFRDDHTIAATHETRLISKDRVIQDPYPVYSVLKFKNGRWRIVSRSFAIDDRKDHNAALMSAGRKIQSKPTTG